MQCQHIPATPYDGYRSHRKPTDPPLECCAPATWHLKNGIVDAYYCDAHVEPYMSYDGARIWNMYGDGYHIASVKRIKP